MCTWRVCTGPFWQRQRFLRIQPLFVHCGFTVNVMPEIFCEFHIQHPRESQLSYFLLRHPEIVAEYHFERIV